MCTYHKYWYCRYLGTYVSIDIDRFVDICEEQAEGCISAQESVPRRYLVDPNYSPIATTRSCNCIGNNRPKTKPVQEEDDSGVVQRVKS